MTTFCTPKERLADGIVHGLGVTAGSIALMTLLWLGIQQAEPKVLVAFVLYGAALVAMLGFSAAYHMTYYGPLKAILRRLDVAAIFVMIAGSYTPFALLMLDPPWDWVMFTAAWMLAMLGIVLELTMPQQMERVRIGLYLAQGWLILVVIKPLINAASLLGMVLLVLGGLLYTVGVIFHLKKRLPFHNAIWHGFVLVAAGSHFTAILIEVA